MFGLVNASISELKEEEKKRYQAVYCGICRRIGKDASQFCRLGLSYDMAFLALLLGSLYEPEEQSGSRACLLHPVKPHPWLDSESVSYAADMNVALAYYKCMDDWHDDGSVPKRAMASVYDAHMEPIRGRYPRQCRAIEACIARLSELESENCANPDEPAGVFGTLMSELLVLREDLWAPTLRQMGHALGRFIYLADALLDLKKDRRKGKYNPILAYGDEDPETWKQVLVMAMGQCAECFERLPLVQDKGILDNIIYSGVWQSLHRRKKKGEDDRDG